MPESILIQVGQCGNQIGFRFWQSILHEYSMYCNDLHYDSLAQFLNPKSQNKSSSSKSLEESYNARAVLIDMEEKVINEGLRSSVQSLFSKRQILSDVSGSGNNWAVGNQFYGRKYTESIMNIIRHQVEACDNLEAFLFIFSLGGGTGSGLGTAALESVQSEFSKIPRIAFSVFPSVIDDVITSPYNAVLANYKLAENANIIIPFENQVCNNIFMKMERNKFIKTANARSKLQRKLDGCKPFDQINDLIVNTILDFTSSSRYPGTLNVDMNDLVMNLTPHPLLRYAVPSTAPFIFAPEDSKIERIFNDLFSENHQLFGCSKRGVLCSGAIIGRGLLTVSDFMNNINRLEQNFKFVPWNPSCWKHGLCNFAPAGRLRSLLLLSNTSSIYQKFFLMKRKFDKMYHRKAHMHHFSEVDSAMNATFDCAITKLSELIEAYAHMESFSGTDEIPRPFII